jgi:hypothetical protein
MVSLGLLGFGTKMRSPLFQRVIVSESDLAELTPALAVDGPRRVFVLELAITPAWERGTPHGEYRWAR